ncbi:unnamed protein product [Dibothriocephalus latus]|uniref:Uncharacterized protein n=1 Tax=Dibothriocephalus latus TaxID=60516 RepID=A0A3P7QY38_DIBLA|nr:unnamed protein product [Dibothriocephalus latus]
MELRTTTFRLAERDGGRLTCIREDEVTRIPVTCPVSAAAKVIATDCQQNRRNVTTFRPVLDPATCSCLVRQETRTEACDCEKKNFMRVACAGNALIVSIGEFSSLPGDRHCTIKASQKTEPIDCPRNEEIVNPGTGCSVEMKGGLYRAEIRRWQEVENCRCVPRQKILHSLCSCQKPQTVEVCEDHSKLIVERLVFHRIGDRCMPNHQIINREIPCPEQKVWASPCSQEFRTVRVVFYKLLNQTCVRFTKALRQRCACPQPIRRLYCDGEGRWVKCLTEFLFNNEAKTCRISKQCVRWTPVCPPRRRITLASCTESTNFMQTLQTVEFSLDQPTCRCRVRKQAPWREFCRKLSFTLRGHIC